MRAATIAPTPMRALILHTHDVARSLKPSVDGELANALHETLHFALDGREEDWGIRDDEDERRCGPSTASGNGPNSASGRATIGVNGSVSAQDPQADAEEEEDYESLPPARSGFFLSSNPERPYISYAWNERSQTLTLPNPVVVANPTTQDPCSPENRSEFDVTAKFFYLDDAHASGQDAREERFPVAYIDDALKRLTMSTSLITIDTFIVSFPTLRLDIGGSKSCCGSAHDDQRGNATCTAGSATPGALPSDGCGITPCTNLSRSAALANHSKATVGVISGRASSSDHTHKLREDIQAVKQVWEAISPNPQLVSLGIADISLPALQQLLSSSDASTSGKNAISRGETALPSDATVPSAARKPRLVTVNVKGNPCAIDKELNAWCEKQDMLLVAHNDQRDLLPARTLPALLQEFEHDLPHPAPVEGRLRPRWVLKYSTVIRERGILADKGYIVYAEWI
ncbi:hypothetical protein K437DRAFT_257926 [Tilletiaria anomala UBC 951]|uniref:Glutamate--cysteine ligase modifier subunit n=1 Tax=Tilletiaria anomala (strain ATCC 24038 / CBS 436.72 / UBC 951) TaxID=1037660 RepID=A0A066VPV7_TILAU|nr:uncharacterized protein K437DRAFT_257926 [Tilletiaria anomala UBC 951]KDN42293.1 hypothetical protein K437DRAFT_257926 [Tilletiaria anomala UBC 951]